MLIAKRQEKIGSLKPARWTDATLALKEDQEIVCGPTINIGWGARIDRFYLL